MSEASCAPCFLPLPCSVGDFLGRFLSGFGPWAHHAPAPLSILAYSVVRCAIAAAILFCHLVTPATWMLDEYLSQVMRHACARAQTLGCGREMGAAS